jgi:phage gpG-like protein
MTAAEGGGIFISYRRQETSHLAGRLYDRLAGRFGEGQVFIDVDTIEPGVDFAEEIFRAVAACKVLLAIIGPTWLTAADERGCRRLNDPDDIVRLEVEAALARAVRVIPILVEGAVMPVREDLPESLAALARRNALPIRHESFRADAGRLVTAIERVLAAPGTAVASADPGTRLGDDAASDVAQKGSEPAQSDVSRVIRLLADAERIANSITSEFWKASALSGIAAVLAATDPDRAERIANSITSEFWKPSALSGIAVALAATDPLRAERIANSITSEFWKVSALSGIAVALAATDPERAARLLADAERIANSITSESSKASALSGIAKALAATDPRRAERIANSITSESSKASALSGIAKALAATDPDRATRLLADAERIANSITDESSKESALSDIAKALAAIDPDRAERIANSITDGSSKASALSDIAKALAAMSS